MPATTTTAANVIRESYEPGFQELAYRNNSLMGLFPAPVSSRGDTAFRWKINSAGQTGEIFTEGQAQPAAGNQTWTNAAISWVYFRVMCHFTGHLRDALLSNWVDAIEEEMILAQKDLVDLINTTWMGSTYGLEVAVDSTSTYAGISRGSAAYFEATETAVSDQISHTDLEDLIEVIEDNDKGGEVGLWIGPKNQRTNIYRITGQPFVAGGSPRDKLEGFLTQTIAGTPAAFLPDWTNTVLMALDMRPGKFVNVVHRQWNVKDMGPSGDSDLYQLSYANVLADKAPKYDGKLTGVTA